jgi:hypothetical protein
VAIARLLGMDATAASDTRPIDAALLRELTAVRDRLDARLQCLAHNRDALSA